MRRTRAGEAGEVTDARQAVRAVGDLDVSLDREDLRVHLERCNLDDLAEALIGEKVCYRAFASLAHGDGERLRSLERHERFAVYRDRLRSVERESPRVLARIDEIAHEREVTVWGIKGLTAQHWYEDRSLRDLGDLDVAVATVDDAFVLTEQLRDAGYTYERREVPWVKRTRWGDLYGQINLKSAVLHALPNVDVHFGAYSVRHCGIHPFALPPGEGFQTISMEKNLPFLVGNAAGDHRVTTKDLNDLVICLRADVDWAEVIAALERVKLDRFFARMLGILAERRPEMAEAMDQVLGPRLARLDPERPRPGVGGVRWRRVTNTIHHAWKVGVRSSIVDAAVAAATAARYYTADLDPRVVRAKRPHRLPAPQSWRCVRLIPAESLGRILDGRDDGDLGPAHLNLTGRATPLSEHVQVVHTAAGDIVRTPSNDFIPTVYFDLDRRLVVAAGVDS